ncbi:ABC transporter permease [Photobacterium damselae]|nr:ABC transporter permease [Photobacterium damselae]
MSVMNQCWWKQTLLHSMAQFGAVIALVFIIIKFSPLDPVNQFLGGNVASVSVEQKQLIAEHLGANQGYFERLLLWGEDVLLHGGGYSNLYQQSVSDVIDHYLPHSLILMGLSWLLILILGYSLGVVSAYYQDSVVDKWLCRIAWCVSSIPSFWLGLVFLSLFAIKLQWLPLARLEEGSNIVSLSLVLPLVTLVLTSIPNIYLHTREKTVAVLQSDYIQYAKAHQLPFAHLVRFYIFPNSFTPALLLQLTSLAELISGSVMIETVFNYPGLGHVFLQACLASDVALLAALTCFAAGLVLMGNLLACFLQYRLMPSCRANLL